MSFFILLMVIVVSSSISPVKTVDFNETVNLRVNCDFDLTTQLVQVRNTIVFENRGLQPLNHYIFINTEELTYFVNFYNRAGQQLSYRLANNSNVTGEQWSIFEIDLDETVPPNHQYKLISTMVYGGRILPKQRVKSLKEDQVVAYRGSLLFFSPYQTMDYRVKYLCKSESILEFHPNTPNVSGSKIVYTFSSLDPYTASPEVSIVFVNNDRLVAVKQLERTIDISHFGQIFIEDRVIMQNNGPALRGSFASDKLDKSATDWFFTHLPASAENIKFFDELGNNSKTQVNDANDCLILKFKPRYPLVGDWKTSYILQYNVPTYEYLLTDRKRFFNLTIRAVDHVIDDKIIEMATVKIILPEGARTLKVRKPDGFSLVKEEIVCLGQLCVFGRPTVVLSAKNLLEHYSSIVTVEYNFYFEYLSRAPVLIMFYLQLVFAIVIIYKYFGTRLNLKN